MNKQNVIIGAVAVIFLVLVFFFIRGISGGLLRKTGTVTLGSQKIKLEEVSKKEDLEKGLSGRKTLAHNRGMVFLFNKPGYNSFWMKGMQFPIDIIYVNGKQVVTIISNAEQPAKNTPDNELPVYTPTAPADRVIEVNAGVAQKNNVKVGDTLDLNL